jgi:biopolymer transport protein TolR
MTFSRGGGNGMSSEINVTPMIDVLLVLLIIFMVIAPAMPKGELAALPRPAMNDGRGDQAVVLELRRLDSGEVRFRINQHEVAREDVPSQLESIYARRADRVLFIAGDDRLSFTQVAEAIDMSRAAGAERIGLVTHGIERGL